MFDKRLIALVPGVMRHIVASVVYKCAALVFNIAIIMTLGNLFSGLLALQAAGILGPASASALLSPQTFALLGVAIAGRALAIYRAQRAGDRAAFAAKRQIRQRIYDKLADLGPSYAEGVSTAEAVQTSVEGAQQLEVYFGGYLPQLFYAVLAPIILFAALVASAPVPAVVLLVIVPLIPVSIMMVMKNAKKVAAEYWDSYVDLGGSFLEAVQGLTTLKIYRADGRWHARMNDEAEGFRRATMKMLRVQLNSINVMDLVAFGGAAVGVVVAVQQLAAGDLTFAAAFSVVFLSQEFFLPMRRLGSLFHTAMNGMSAAKTMLRILDAQPPARGDAGVPAEGDIELTSVGYAYGERTVLEGVDERLPRGGFIALVGASGSGKSTLAGILSGRKLAYAGQVSIGGVELREASLDSLARTVTLVPSAGHLFVGTVRENLLLAKGDAGDAELWDVLARCRMDGFVRASGGLDMAVAEGGRNLSGGQRQRLCVARALLRDASIYIFDEATSNVDAESERAIGRVIEELAGEHTVVVIAHRLASVAAADAILVLDGGRVVERGRHEELLVRGGRYAELWASQAVLEEEVAAGEGFAGEAAGTAEAVEGLDAVPAPAPVAPGAAGARVDAPAPAGAHRSAAAVIGRMVGLVRPLLPYLLLAIFLGVAGSLTATFLITFGAYGLMDAVGAGAPFLAATAACVALAICGIVRGPLHYGEQLCNHYIAFRLLAHIRDLVFAQLRRLAPAKLEGRQRGDLISLVTADIELLEVFYAHTISPIAIAVLASLAMVAFIGAQSLPMAGLALAGYLVIGAVLPVVSSRLCGRAGRASRDGAGAISAYVLDSLRGLSESIQFGGVAERSRGLRERTDAMGAVDRGLHVRMAGVEAAADVLVLAFSLAMVGLGAHLAAAGEVSVATAFVCAFAFFSSMGPVLAVARLGTSLQATLASGERVLDLLDEEPETEDVPDFAGAALDPRRFTSAELRDVDFSYARTGERVLSGISLKIAAGQMTCIAGRSGSGKSTLLKLLMRFWDASSGEVRVGGRDVRGIATSSLRACEAYMTQDTHLFVGTLRDNLLVAREDASEEELARACEAAALTEFVGRLPQGLDTPVAELGDSLSGGERQRIGLARVFLHDAPLVLLDEPTSNLDALSEAAVMRAVARLREAGKTVVLVSHRASTVRFADRFFSVEDGRLS